MLDEDGPLVSKEIYSALLEDEVMNPHVIPYALDSAIRKLRELGAPQERWATYVHVGI